MARKRTQIDNETLDEFLIRQYGKDIIATADKALPPNTRDVLHTPLSLDIALGGGIPDGTVCFITGKPKSGKSTLCLELIRNAQLLDRPTYYINIEKRCTPALLSTIQGLDPTKLNVIPHQIEKPLTAEDYLNIIERIAKTKEKAVVVVDSIAALSTMAEQQEDIGSNKDMAGPAKLLSAFFRRAQQIVDSKNVILIFISQMISNREPRGPKYIEKGGLAIQYACSVWLKVTWAQQWDRNTETNAPDGHDMHITVQSSALGRPFLPCVLPLRYGKGIDIIKDVVTVAENLGLVEKAGAWFSIPLFAENDETPKFHGLARLSNFLRDNPDKLAMLDKEVRDTVLPKEQNDVKKQD
jgi:recombination protein RecA